MRVVLSQMQLIILYKGLRKHLHLVLVLAREDTLFKASFRS